MKIKLQTMLKHNWRTLLLLSMLITMSQGMWGWTINTDVYFYNNASWSGNIGFEYWYSGGHTWYNQMESLGNGVYKQSSPTSRSDISSIRFYSSGGSEYNNVGHDFNAANSCCFYPSNGGVGFPPVWTFSIKNNGTTTYGGDGSSDSPYHVKPGTSVEVCENSIGKHSEVGAGYTWKSTGDWTTTKTGSSDSFTLNANHGKKYAQSRAYSKYNNTYNDNYCESNQIYFVADVYDVKVRAYYSNNNSTYTNGTTGGTVYVSGSGTGTGTPGAASKDACCYGSVTVVATAASGYTFKGWYQNSNATGTCYSTNASYSLGTIDANKTIYACFVLDAPSNIYLKGPLWDASCWSSGTNGYNTAFSHTSGTYVYTQTITGKRGDCVYVDESAAGEFVLSTAQDDANKLNGGTYTFNYDGANPRWTRSSRSGQETNFLCTIDYADGDLILVTVTMTALNTYKMKLERVCSAPTVSTSPTGSGTVCPGALTLNALGTGGVSTLYYQWYRNTSSSVDGATSVSEKATAAQWGNHYKPTTTDAGSAYYYFCKISSSDGCESYSVNTSLTSAITVKSSSVVISPSVSRVKSYEPAKLTSTNANVTWGLSTESSTNYLYDQSKRLTKFKGSATGSPYTITATAADGLFECNGVATVIVEADNDCTPVP